MKIRLNDYGMEVVKAFYLADLATVADYKVRGWHKDAYQPWHLLAPHFPEVRAWIDAGLTAYKPDGDGHSRVSCIPGGCLSCVNGWDDNTCADEEWGGYHGKLEGRIWTFQAGLKNYWHDIEHFLQIMIPAIAEEVIVGTVHYEDTGLCFDLPEDLTVDWRLLVKNHPDHKRIAKERDEEIEQIRKRQGDRHYGGWY